MAAINYLITYNNTNPFLKPWIWMLIKQLKAQGTIARWCFLVEFSQQTKMINSIKTVFKLKKKKTLKKPKIKTKTAITKAIWKTRDCYVARGLFSFLWECWQMPLIKHKQELFMQAFPLWIIFELLNWANPSKWNTILKPNPWGTDGKASS